LPKRARGSKLRAEANLKKLLLLSLVAASAIVACSTAYSGVDGAATPSDAGEDARDPGDPGDSGAPQALPDGAYDASLDGDGGPWSDGALDGSDDGGGGPLPSCGDAGVALGEYATWSGKVNVHRGPGMPWTVDTDCSSGSNNNTILYCKKFWPTAATQVPLVTLTPEDKPFTAGGGTFPSCGGVYPDVGQVQFVCCAP
jgi:hypothetical protein